LVSDDELERIEYARLVRKGTGDLRRADSLQIGYSMQSPFWSGASACQGPFLGYALDMRAVTLAPRAGLCRSTFDNPFLHASADEFDVEIRGSHVWDVGRISLSVGIAAGVAWLREEFSSEGPTPSRDAVAAHLGVLGGATVDLVQGFYGGIELDAMT